MYCSCPIPPDAHSRNWILYLRDRSGTSFVKFCAVGHTLLTGIKEILPYFWSVLDTIWQGPRKIIEWLWLSSNSTHIILSSSCDFRRKKGRTFYRCQSNYIFARTDTPPPHSISGVGGATAVTVNTNMQTSVIACSKNIALLLKILNHKHSFQVYYGSGEKF